MLARHIACLALMLLFLGLDLRSSLADDSIPPVSERARKIHESGMVFDGHNDLPWRLRAAGDMALDSIDLTKKSDVGPYRYPSASARGGSRPNTGRSTSPASTRTPLRTVLEQIDLVYRMCGSLPRRLRDGVLGRRCRAGREVRARSPR